jgi:uncharacterized protein YdhG (YjbR/CyaY superfamily)
LCERLQCAPGLERRRGEAMAMKKAASGVDGLAAVEEYLARVAEPARSTLESVRATIRTVVPAEATECISYGMPAFRYKGALVGYAAFKDHCSFFPMSASLLDDFAEDVKNYRTAKGTLQFSPDKPLSAALLKKLVRARVVQNKAKAMVSGSGKKGR